MDQMKVLFLGWESPAFVHERWSLSCFGTAEALAKKVNVSLIVPQSNPELALENVEVAGLNNINLQAIPTSAPKPQHFPFADENAEPAPIPLYGTPVYTCREETLNRQEQPGEAVAAGTFTQASAAFTKKREEQNLFTSGNFENLSLNAQVIQYARHTTHFASQINFDIIYAHNILTFLAGSELKLRSGKKLVLHVRSLSYTRIGTHNQGWLHEVEKHAFEKSDALIAENELIADLLVDKYGIPSKKIHIAATENLSMANAANALPPVFRDPANSETVYEEPLELDQQLWQINAESEIVLENTVDKIWKVLQQLIYAEAEYLQEAEELYL